MDEKQKKHITEIAKRYNLALVVLFGSRTTGEAGEKSDFDIAYSAIQPITLERENKMAVDFHSALKSENVDLVNLSNASPLLLKKITGEGVPLYESRESQFNELRLYAERLFREAEPLNKLRHDYVLYKISQYKKDVARA